MSLRQIVRYPVKGLPAITLDEVALTAGEQLPGDRRFAFWRGDDSPEGGRRPGAFSEPARPTSPWIRGLCAGMSPGLPAALGAHRRR